LSNQSDFSFIQINKSYSGAILNAIQARSLSKGAMTKRKTRNSRQRKPADGVNLSGWGYCILAALNSAIARKLKVTKNFKGGTSPRIYPWNQSKIENRKSSSPRIYPWGQSKI